MKWFSLIIVGILLIHTSSFVLSQRGFGPEEIKLKLITSKKHEMKIRELSNRLGIKYGELLAKSRKMREINLPNPRANFEIPKRKLIDKFIVSHGRSTMVSPQKNTIIPKKEKSSKKFKLNFEKLSKMFKLSSSNEKNKDKNINNKSEKSTIENFQSGKKSFTREMPETQIEKNQVSKRKHTKRQTFRLNVFKKNGLNNSSKRRKIKINVSMFSRLAEGSESNKKQNLPGRNPEMIPRLLNRRTETAINKHITSTRAEKLYINHDLLDRTTQESKQKFKSGFKRLKTSHILIQVKHKTQKSRLALPNKNKKAEKIKLRSRFEKPEKSVFFTRTSRITQTPKSRFDEPKRKIQSLKIKLRSRFEKPEKSLVFTRSSRFTQASKSRFDKQDKKIQGPKIKLKSRFRKPERRDFFAPDVRKTKILRNIDDIPNKRLQTRKTKLRSRFQQEDLRNNLRQTPTFKTKTPISKLDLPDLGMQVPEIKNQKHMSRIEKSDRHVVLIPSVPKNQTPKGRLDPPNERIKPPKVKLRGRFNIPERRNFLTPDIQKTITEKPRGNFTDRRIQAPIINLRSKSEKPERQKTQIPNKRHSLPDSRIKAPKIKLRSRFEKPFNHDFSKPTARNTQKPRTRLDLPDKRIQHPKMNLRRRIDKQEIPKIHFLTHNIRKTQAPKRRPDEPEGRIKKHKIKLRSKFEKPDRQDFWVPPVPKTPTTKNKLHLPKHRIQDIRHNKKVKQRQNTNVFISPERPIPTSTQKTIHEQQVSGIQAQNDKVRNTFKKPPRQSLRQFMNTIKIKKENNTRTVFITKMPSRHDTTTTTVNPTTKTKVTTRIFPTTTSSTTVTAPEKTIPTTNSTTSTTRTSIPPTTTLPPKTTTLPPTTTTLVPKTTISPPVTTILRLTTLPVTTTSPPKTTTLPPTTTMVLTEEKVARTLSGESTAITNLQTEPKLIRLDFSSLPTSGSRTTSIVNRKNAQPTGQTRLRLDFSSFPTTSATSTESQSPTTNEINMQVPLSEKATTSTILLNISGSQGTGDSFGTLASTGTGTTVPFTTSIKVKEHVKPTDQTIDTKTKFSLPSLPTPTSTVSIDSSTSSQSGTDTTTQRELGNIESEILTQLRQTPEFIRASQENTPEADMKLKEVLDGLLINLVPILENPLATTNPDNSDNSGGQTMVSDTDMIPVVREVDLSDPLPTESKLNKAILIPKRFSQPTPNSSTDITDSGAGESDWMFIQSELDKLFPE